MPNSNSVIWSLLSICTRDVLIGCLLAVEEYLAQWWKKGEFLLATHVAHFVENFPFMIYQVDIVFFFKKAGGNSDEINYCQLGVPVLFWCITKLLEVKCIQHSSSVTHWRNKSNKYNFFPVRSYFRSFLTFLWGAVIHI